MYKTRSKKPKSRLKLWLLVLILLLTGLVTALLSSTQARHLLRAQLITSSPYVGGYWPDIYDKLYIDPSGEGITGAGPDPIGLIVFNCVPDVINCVFTTPIDDYYAKKFAAECKSLHPNNPWAQITCASAKLTAYYNTTKTHECCRNYARDMQKIIPLLQWGDAKVTVGQHTISIQEAFPALPSGHVVNHIHITFPSGPYAGKTFSYMYDAGWFPRYFYPTDDLTQAYYDEHSQWSFPYYPPQTTSSTTPSPQPSLPPASLTIPQ